MSATGIKAQLARFMDPEAFNETVPVAMKHTAKSVAKTFHDKHKVRREIAMKRADAAIRYFGKPGNLERLAKAIEDRRAGAENKGRIGALCTGVAPEMAISVFGPLS